MLCALLCPRFGAARHQRCGDHGVGSDVKSSQLRTPNAIIAGRDLGRRPFRTGPPVPHGRVLHPGPLTTISASAACASAKPTAAAPVSRRAPPWHRHAPRQACGHSTLTCRPRHPPMAKICGQCHFGPPQGHVKQLLCEGPTAPTTCKYSVCQACAMSWFRCGLS
jgi:hypothetical protein